MRFDFLSVIPDVFDEYMHASILGRALLDGHISYAAHDLRDWTHDAYHKVDDEPFGGGAGQLMMCAPIFEATDDLAGPETKIVVFSASGQKFTQKLAYELAQQNHVLFICGRYEGIDERVLSLANYNLSVGDYVLTGGELPALTVCDAVTRLIPGVLGNDLSVQDESFSNGLLEYPQYTRPANYRGMEVPEVLRSGNHQKIAEWRKAMAMNKTQENRPDLLK